MTPREPDRFDKQAREMFLGRSNVGDWTKIIAAALRAAESSALERAAREVERCGFDNPKETAEAIRFLKPPAAAHAACTCRYLSGTRFENPGNCPVHPDAPAAETGKAQGDDDTNVPDDIDPRNFEKYDAEAQKRIAELEAALRRAHGEGCICVACEKRPR